MIDIEVDRVIVESEVREIKVKNIDNLSDDRVGGLINIEDKRRVLPIDLDDGFGLKIKQLRQHRVPLVLDYVLLYYH